MIFFSELVRPFMLRYDYFLFFKNFTCGDLRGNVVKVVDVSGGLFDECGGMEEIESWLVGQVCQLRLRHHLAAASAGQL